MKKIITALLLLFSIQALTFAQKTRVSATENKTTSKVPNKVEMKYKGFVSLKFIYDKKTDFISDLQIYLVDAGKTTGEYKTLEITENEGGIPYEMYCEATYKDRAYLVVYKPKSMNTVTLTIINPKTKESKDYTLKRDLSK